MRSKACTNAAIVLMLAATGASWAAAAPDANRTRKAEAIFKLTSPCPATNQTGGTCSGYVIDRVVPLVCGGEETPDNMQWQTLAAAREKDKWERIGCRPGRKLVIPSGESFTEVYAAGTPEPVTDVQALPK